MSGFYRPSTLARLLISAFSFCRSTLSKLLISAIRKLAAKSYENLDYLYAEIAYKLILHVQPEDQDSIEKLVLLLEQNGRNHEVIEILENWLKDISDDVGAHLFLADLYGREGEISKAKEHLDACSQVPLDSLEMLILLGNLRRYEGKLLESCEFFRSALQQQEIPPVLYGLAQNLIDQGNQKEAIVFLERSVKLEPDFARPYHSLARCKYYDDIYHPHVDYMKTRVAARKLPAIKRIAYHFALGEIFDQQGDWVEAFANFKAANDLKWSCSRFSMVRYTKRIDKLIKTFDTSFLSDVQAPTNSGENLIFVTGMPRSGTTLTEQILASHPDVSAGGERHDIDVIIQQLNSDFSGTYPDCVRRLDHDSIAKLVQKHYERISSVTNQKARFVDKSLNSVFEMGLIATLFPSARIVHCRRQCLDTCVSCYFQDFLHLRYSCDLKTLGLVFCQYERIMSHWMSVLPGRVFELQYEDLVAEPESQVRKLLAYCDLPWHEGCLSPHQTKRAVHTCSATQVKRPINSGSVGRWKNYDKYIGPLKDVLRSARLT